MPLTAMFAINRLIYSYWSKRHKSYAICRTYSRLNQVRLSDYSMTKCKAAVTTLDIYYKDLQMAKTLKWTDARTFIPS